MKINNALVLAAGFGTRMGIIGQSLPKVMWPLFEKPLVALQIEYAKKLGCENIFVNTHFCSELVERYLRSNYPEVIILHEDPILDVGGAIHNVAKRFTGLDEQLLVLNGDLFYWISEVNLERSILLAQKGRALLFGIEVGPSYSEIVVSDGLLRDIIPKSQKKRVLTYSGVSIINMKGLKYVEGPSKFFKTIANYKNEDVYVMNSKNDCYYDFGTADRYYNQLFDLLRKYKRGGVDPLVQLCSEKGFIDSQKCESSSKYNSQVDNIINLGKECIRECESSGIIVLNDPKINLCKSHGIYYQDTFQPISL